MAYRYLQQRKEKCTRDLVHEFANMDKWPGERPLNEKRLQYLENELLAGRWRTPNWAFCYLNGKKYRVNGQHSSTMLDRSNGHFPEGADVAIDEWLCESDFEVGMVFSTYDNQESARRTSDQTRAVAIAEVPDVRGCDLVRITSGMMGVENAFKKREYSGILRGSFARQYAPFVKFASGVSMSPGYKRPPIYGAMFSMYKLDAYACGQFWTLVIDESAPSPTHPTRLLAKFIREARGASDVNTYREIYAKSVYAWNAWRRGAVISKLQYKPGQDLPEPI